MIKKFIENNNLSLKEGTRNTDIVTLIGYSQHLGLTKKDLEISLMNEIEEDNFIQEEIDRLWEYCNNRNYKNYWSKPETKLIYKF
jgi:hypothetical protein